jgi:hypothetical protein
MQTLQRWLVTTLEQPSTVRTLMEMTWSWSIAESIHFIGLCLLIGAIGSFDLRLLGVARRVPIAAMHRLIPWGLLGFGLNALTGVLFVMTYPDQYLYNPSFHFKVLFLTIGGLNASAFYLTQAGTVLGPEAAADAPARAKVIAAISLSAWVAVIVCGRLLTFYRPGPCLRDVARVLLTCAPQ